VLQYREQKYSPETDRYARVVLFRETEAFFYNQSAQSISCD
jgi:hypothetical protein